MPSTPSSVTATFVVHYREWQKPTNTAKVAKLLLGDSGQVLLRGAPTIEVSRQTEARIDALDQTLGLVLYPSEDAISLSDLIARDGAEKWRLANLIVPDGTWSQSRRVVRRQVSLQKLTHIKLDPRQSSYHLRRGAESGLLCTLEAVGFALAQLDSNFDLATYLKAFEDWQRRAWLRRWGTLPAWERTLNA